MDSEKYILQLIGAYGKTEDEIRQLNAAYTKWQKHHKDVKNARDLKKLIEYLGFFCEAVRSIEEDICKKTELNSDEATDVLTNILTGLAVYAKSIQDACEYIRISILDIETFENLVSTLTTERDELRAKNENIREQFTEISDLGKKYKALSDKQADDLATLGTERDNLSSDLETCNAEIEKLRSENAAFSDDIHDLGTKNGNLQAENAQLTDEVAALRSEVEKLRSENAALSDDLHDLGTKNGNLQAENAQLTDEVEALRSEIEKLRSEVELHRSESIKLRLENGTFRTNNGKLYAENSDLLSKISEQRAEIDRLHSELADIVPKYAKTGIQNDKLRSELAQITSERDEIAEKYENSRTAAQRNWDKGKAAMAEARRLAREEGIHRKYKDNSEEKYGKAVRKMYAVLGKSYREISKELGISTNLISRLLKLGNLDGASRGQYVEYKGELVLRSEAPAEVVAALTPKKRGRPRKNTGTAPAPAPVELQNPFNSDENPPIEGQLTFNPVNNK